MPPFPETRGFPRPSLLCVGLVLKLMAWLVFKVFRIAVGMLLLSCLVLYVMHRVTRSGDGQQARPAAAPTESAPESAAAPVEAAPGAPRAGEGSVAAGDADGVLAVREGWSGADYEAALRRVRPHSPEERELLEERGLLAQRERWDGQLESLAVRGATDEEIALARDAAERNMAQLADRGRRAVLQVRHGPSWMPPPPDPVEQKRESIARRRQKREASWDRWMARKEGSGMSEDKLAQERAWVERRKAEDRAREDRELAELEERMRRRAAEEVSQAEGPGYNP